MLTCTLLPRAESAGSWALISTVSTQLTQHEYLFASCCQANCLQALCFWLFGSFYSINGLDNTDLNCWKEDLGLYLSQLLLVCPLYGRVTKVRLGRSGPPGPPGPRGPPGDTGKDGPAERQAWLVSCFFGSVVLTGFVSFEVLRTGMELGMRSGGGHCVRSGLRELGW